MFVSLNFNDSGTAIMEPPHSQADFPPRTQPLFSHPGDIERMSDAFTAGLLQGHAVIAGTDQLRLIFMG
jgi:hypothetical protein